MTERIIRTPDDLTAAENLLRALKMPFTLKTTLGAPRSLDQNRLQWKWYQEAAEQLQDETADEKRAWCKLHIGVPILRGEDDEYREAYDRVIKPLPYEQKLMLMGEPLAYPVTSLMKTKQFSQYLDAVYAHFTSQGVVLTEPEGPAPGTTTGQTPAAPEEGEDGPSQPVPQEEPTEPVHAPQSDEPDESVRVYQEVQGKLYSATSEAQIMERWKTNLPALEEACSKDQIAMLARSRDALLADIREKE